MSNPTTHSQQVTDTQVTKTAEKFSVKVESHCIGCSTCVQVCSSVFAMGEGGLEDQKSFVKGDADLSTNETDIDTAVELCPVTAIVKTTS